MIKSSKPTENLLQVSDLGWRVGGKSILEQVTFSVKKGQFVGIIGPNGAGKSSVLRCLYGINTPSSGHIELHGQNIKNYSRREIAQQIAVVLQEQTSQFELQVIDVIRMGLTPHKSLLSFDTSQDESLLLEAASQVDLDQQLSQQFKSLSGGEKQRAMIARAIVQQPQILVMDEPTNHLDIRHQLEVLELAKSMGITVIVSIHDLNLAASFCDSLILLNKGKIVAQGEPEQVLTEKILERVFGVKSMVDLHPFTHKLRISFNADLSIYG